jgi:hypothetical protein
MMHNPPPGQPPEHAAYPPPGAQPAPPQAYGAQPYPPAYLPYPRRSGARTFWIVFASIVGTLLLVGGGVALVWISGGFEGRPTVRTFDSEPEASGAAPASAPETTASPALVGRWCVPNGYTQFNADGTLVGVNSGRTQYGSWREVSAGRINMITGGQTIVANYVIAGTYLSMTSSSGATGQFTRC